MNNLIKTLLLVMLILVVGGCSGKSSDPVTPSANDYSGPPLTGVTADNHSHNVWESGTINIDTETMRAVVVPDRKSDTHYDATGSVPMDVVVNSIDTVNWVADIDVTIFNTTDLTGFDLRLIIMATGIGHRLLNADDWTMNFDDVSDGFPINPFKAYAKSIPTREFWSGFNYTENLLIRIPGGNASVPYVVDVSWPDNCEEPYEIKSFTHDELYDTADSSAAASVNVYGWDVVNSVELYLPAITGVAFVPFTLDSGDYWTIDLTNEVGASPGDYVGYIKATTTGSGGRALFDEVMVTVTKEPTAEYIGSMKCSMCHWSIREKWLEHGHRYMLSEVKGVSPPTYPFTTLQGPPAGYTWHDLTYVIGGYGWKARFMDSNGWIITGDEVQWNIQTEEWSEYYSEIPPGVKPYDCGSCHTTGWVSTGVGGPHQDDLPGIWGTFSEAGIACEACHGPGSEHFDDPSTDNITKDNSSALCGQCHSRGDQDRVFVSDNLVEHNQQYNEILGSPHGGSLTCVSCHDSHASSKYDELAEGDGYIAQCTDCHDAASHQVQGLMSTLDCTDCHMPLGTKSAVSTGEGVFLKGDLHNHIFKIDTTGVPLEDYFETDGSSTWIAEIDGELRLNLAWACMQCHDGIQAFELDNYALSAERARGIHETSVEQHYIGSELCGYCHDAKYELWLQSGHPYIFNKVNEGTPPDYPFSSVPNTPVGYTWDDVTYEIGGFGWKALFLDSNGWIVTGEDVQWNLQTETWSDYNSWDPPGTKPYDCGTCHTTGWVATGEGGPHQDDLPGIWGTFAEGGVGCEACHGMGAQHVRDPGSHTIIMDDSASLCGQCHVSDAPDKIFASGNLVDHHQQYSELIASPHSLLKCVTCHGPHTSTKYDDLADGVGLKRHCTDCHSAAEHQIADSMSNLDCLDCHMPYGTKSAVTTGEGVHLTGDLRNHIFRIDIDGVDLVDYFETDGTNTWIGEIDGEIKLNLAWVCMQCHNGIDGFPLDNYEFAAWWSEGIHDN